jgi:hypothetical protein
MKRVLACATLGSLVLVGATSLAGAAVTPRAKTTTTRYFEKNLVSGFTNSAGVPIAQNAAPAVGDEFSTSGDLYHGNHSHYGKSLAASDYLHCIFTTLTQSAFIGKCTGVISINGSLIISESTQNFASSSGPSVYPITGGTGVFNQATGRVVTTNVGKTNNSDFTIEVTTS